MVNNAGVVGNIKGDPLTALDSSDWDRSYQINLRGVFYCCKAIYPTFAGQGYGNILNTASVAGKTGAPEIAEYSAMKAGVINFTQTLSRELGPKNINVNCICPGFVYTPLYLSLIHIYIGPWIVDTISFAFKGIPHLTLTSGFYAINHTQYDNMHFISEQSFITPLQFSEAMLNWLVNTDDISQGYPEDLYEDMKKYGKMYGWGFFED